MIYRSYDKQEKCLSEIGAVFELTSQNNPNWLFLRQIVFEKIVNKTTCGYTAEQNSSFF